MHRLRGRKALSWRLPVLISGLLVAALTAFAFVGYRQLTSALLGAAKARVVNAANLLARTVESSVPQVSADLTKSAADSAVRRFVQTEDAATRDAATRFLVEKVSKTSQVIAVELRDRNGKRVLWVDGPAAAKAPRLREGHVESSPPPGLAIGPIVADRGSLYHEAAFPITTIAGDTIGRFVEFRAVSSAQGVALIGGLIGSDATILFSSPGVKWNNLETLMPGPPVVPDGPQVISYTALDGSERLGAAVPVKLTPWLVWVDIHKDAIVAPARRFLKLMVLTGLLILIVGTIGAWLISRQITAPLREIALAASDISTGDYTRRVTVRSEDEIGFLGGAFNDMARDLTRQRKLEDQLLQAQKMEAVGQLAGGVAHDFNNLLTVIMSYSSMMLADGDATDPNRGDIQAISDAAARAAALTRQLLAFSRKQVLQLQPVNVNAVVIEVERMLCRLIGEDILLSTHLAPRLALINADPGQLEQVLLNLAVNARDAMPDGGTLTLTTDNADLSDEHIDRHLGAAPGKYIMLAVTDTGTGMTREVQQRLFEPFYTTKSAGKGTGLGLSTVHGIVKQLGGDLYVYSELGHGTTFKVYFPQLTATPEIVIATVEQREAPRGSETILLAEDDDALRSLGSRVLGAFGYNVLVARTGSDALRIVAEHLGRIDLVATDVVMPEMSGGQLVEKVLKARPGIRVLFMSGYTDDEVMRRGVIDGQTAFLQKPFTPDMLAHKVRAVLDAPATVVGDAA
jgi:signal transduction histidine kinase/ActR/RegA family two-component response regulator